MTETPPPAPAGRSAERPGGGWREWLASPFVPALAACLVLAAVSAAVLPTVPSYDPWSWVTWGREVFDPALSFTVAGGPSWKPLPVIFTTVFGLFGGAAPALWVIMARAGGLLGLVAAFRLGSRLVAGSAGVAGPASDSGSAGDSGSTGVAGSAAVWAVVAGLLGAAAVALTQDWAYYMFRGTSEPMLIGASLWAIDRHLAGRFGSAFMFGVAASLIRPEAWPLLLGYAVWLWLREPRLRALVVVGLLAIPFFWFVPPWIGSGDPFLAASHAKAYNGHLGSHPFLTVLRRGVDLQTLPVLLLGLVAVAIGWFRGRGEGGGWFRGGGERARWFRGWGGGAEGGGRDRLVVTLAGFALVWWVIVVAMTLDGYPGLERFYLPAAAVTCVLAGAAVVWLAQLVAARVAPAAREVGPAAGGVGPSAGRAGLAAGALTTLVLIAVSVPFLTGRISTARRQESVAARAVTRLDQLSAAVAAVGGHRGVYPCHSSFAAINHGVQTALAWKLHVTLGRVGTVMRHQGLLFVGPHDTIDGGPAPISRKLTRVRLIRVVGAWKVYRVTAPGSSTRCVGG